MRLVARRAGPPLAEIGHQIPQIRNRDRADAARAEKQRRRRTLGFVATNTDGSPISGGGAESFPDRLPF
jgi:hypothetical protein